MWTRLNSKNQVLLLIAVITIISIINSIRVPTVRESARIQSFPGLFVLMAVKEVQLKQVGNAVPPR